MTDYVKTEVVAGIMTLTLARPDKKNALSSAMYSALSDGLERAEKDPAMFALGEPLDAASALACGLANAVVLAAELRSRARAAAEALTRRPPGALSHAKALMRNFEAIAAQIDREGAIFKERLQTAEAREAFTALAERRAPNFSSAAG